jgi:hypothetical protein
MEGGKDRRAEVEQNNMGAGRLSRVNIPNLKFKPEKPKKQKQTKTYCIQCGDEIAKGNYMCDACYNWLRGIC